MVLERQFYYTSVMLHALAERQSGEGKGGKAEQGKECKGVDVSYQDNLCQNPSTHAPCRPKQSWFFTRPVVIPCTKYSKCLYSLQLLRGPNISSEKTCFPCKRLERAW